MGRKALLSIMAVAGCGLALPTAVDAQTWKDVQVADIETMRDKFTQLAEAFDADQYD